MRAKQNLIKGKETLEIKDVGTIGTKNLNKEITLNQLRLEIIKTLKRKNLLEINLKVVLKQKIKIKQIKKTIEESIRENPRILQKKIQNKILNLKRSLRLKSLQILEKKIKL